MAYIQYQKGDIFESKAQVIVNTVNCQGVMGKGLALAFKEKFPDMFAVYQQDCKSRKLRIGRPILYKESTPWILNFPTKDHWRLPSKLEYLEKGLEFLVAHYKKAGIKSIAFPKLGAQNGKLSWDEVGPLMAKYLSQLDIDVYVYITEDDKKYQYDPILDSKIKERIWKQFSDLALSIERLCQEVGLSKREAKKVVKQREVKAFESQADIDNIEKLAKTSSQKIKKYIDRQRVTAIELPDLPVTSNAHQLTANGTTKASKQKRKKPDKTTEMPVELLFPERELVS